MTKNYTVDIAPSSIVDDCVIGEGTKIWNFSNLYGCTIGRSCTVGSFVEIQSGVEVGDYVTVSSHSFLCRLVKIEDHVFIGHGVMTINDLRPPSKKRTGFEHEWKPTLIQRGSVIGSNATLLPVQIGEGAIVAAGAVVTHDVQPFSIVAGNPAKLVGVLEEIEHPIC